MKTKSQKWSSTHSHLVKAFLGCVFSLFCASRLILFSMRTNCIVTYFLCFLLRGTFTLQLSVFCCVLHSMDDFSHRIPAVNILANAMKDPNPTKPVVTVIAKVLPPISLGPNPNKCSVASQIGVHKTTFTNARITGDGPATAKAVLDS